MTAADDARRPNPGCCPGWSQAFTVDDLTQLRQALRRQAQHRGLHGERLADLLSAAHELVINAVRHGGGYGTVQLRHDADMLICEVTDEGPGFPAAVPTRASPPPTDGPGGRGLWLADQLTDGLTVRNHPSGVTASVALRLPGGEGGHHTV